MTPFSFYARNPRHPALPACEKEGEWSAHAYLQKEVKVKAQVEQRSIQPSVFVTLNLDLSLDLPMGCPQSESASAPSLLKA
jgi:hypothetical protein